MLARNAEALLDRRLRGRRATTTTARILDVTVHQRGGFQRRPDHTSRGVASVWD